MKLLWMPENTGLKKTVSNLVLFVGEKFNIDNLKGYISKDEYAYISDLLNTSNFKNYIKTNLKQYKNDIEELIYTYIYILKAI